MTAGARHGAHMALGAVRRAGSQAALWWNTIRWLRPRQVYGRLWFRVQRPRPELAPAPPRRALGGAWVAPAAREPSLLSPERVSLLAEIRDIGSARAWDAPDVPKLWRYHLHYFDDLTARAAQERAAWHTALLERWIVENPPGQGTGWEPYPTSRRIVSWIKWALGGGPMSSAVCDSLAVQTRWLARRLEWHLLGNHLWANAKALILAGCFFGGPEAERWGALGVRILMRELSEQVLPDGGHFELSPSYHALALEDVLDLSNAARAWPGQLPAPLVARLTALAPAMLRWLNCMCHPDGDIAAFNDSALDLAPRREQLAAYASRVGVPHVLGPRALEHLEASGYVCVERGPFWLIADVARVGPDYQPGHAHADSLSFELSVFGQRWLVNSGCSTYAPGRERARQRGTAAHNTVLVDGRDSSEVWSSFRVGRRARPLDVVVASDAERAVIRAAHDGYARHGVLHRRELSLGPRALVLRDELTGPFTHAESRLHLHPAVQLQRLGPSRAQLQRDGHRLVLHAEDAELVFAPSSYHPSFNRSQMSQLVTVPFSGPRQCLRLEVA